MTRRAFIIFLIAFAASWTAACSQAERPVFDPAAPRVEWPKPPDTARIRYLGEISGEESLHAAKKFPGFGELLSGPKTTIAFSTPTAVAVAGERIFVADGQNQAVFRIDLTARTIQTIREADGKPLQWPADVLIANQELVVVDSRRAEVLYFDLDGQYRRLLNATTLKRPCAAAWDRQTGNLYVIDAAAHQCCVFDSAGKLTNTLGKHGSEPGAFNFPSGLACLSSGTVAVADSMNFRVQLLGPDSAAARTIGKKGDAAGDFALPRDVAVDSQGHLYVLDNQFENIQIFDAAGQLLMSFGQEGHGPGEFYLPSGITIDAQDRIWIADTYNRRVQVFQYLSTEAH